MAFPDALQSRGLYQYKAELPFVPGAEIAGVVRSAPADSGFAKGDRVAGLTMLNGGMAEVVALQPDRVFKLPDSGVVRGRRGPAVQRPHHASRAAHPRPAGRRRDRAGARRGGRHRHLDAATGAGLGAARTIAVVGTEDKIAIAKAAGASDVVLADGFKDAVMGLTDGKGVDIVVDPVGGDRFTDSLRCLAPGGRLLVIGFTGGEIPTVKVNRLLLNNVDAVGVGWGAWTFTHPDYLREQWDELEPLLASGAVSAPQPEIYPLERAGEAIASLENRTAKGKVVVKTPVRLLRRRRSVPVGTFDAATGQWTEVDAASAVDRDELTLATYNIWFDSKHAEQRYLAIAELLSRRTPDIMVFQEVTPAALERVPGPAMDPRRVFARGGHRRRCRRLRNADAVPVARLPCHVYAAAHAPVARIPAGGTRTSTEHGRSSAAYTSTAGSRRRGCAAGSCVEYSAR